MLVVHITIASESISNNRISFIDFFDLSLSVGASQEIVMHSLLCFYFEV